MLPSRLRPLPAFMAAGLLAAPTPELPPGHWPLRSYGEVHGLGSRVPMSMATSREGFLWIGTDAGLYRFDGHRFVLYQGPEGTPTSEIRFVQQDGRGHIWLLSSHRLIRFDGPQPKSLEGKVPPAQSLVRGPGANIYLATAQGPFVAKEGDTFQCLPGWPGGEATALAQAADPAELLVARSLSPGGPSEVLVTDTHGSWRRLGPVPDRVPVRALLEDRHGQVWARTTQALYSLKASGGAFQSALPREAISTAPTLQLDSRDRLWVPFDQGVYILAPGAPPRLVQQELRPHGHLRGMFLDDQDGLWIFSHGLYRIPSPGDLVQDLYEDLGNPLIWCFHRDRRGILWAGSGQGALEARQGRWNRLPGTGDHQVRSIQEGPDGRLYMACADPTLLVHDPATGKTQALPVRPHADPGRLFRLLMEPDGTLWLATERAGLLRLRVTPQGLDCQPGIPDPGMEHARVADIAMDAHGRLLAATTQGLAVREGGKWHCYTRAEGLPEATLAYVSPMADGQILVAPFQGGGAHQILLQQGRIQVKRSFGAEQGLTGDRVFLMHQDRRGRIWIGTSTGLSCFTADGATHLTRGDGLTGEDFCAQAILEEPDGRLWFGCTEGILRVEPGEALMPRPTPSLTLLDLSPAGPDGRSIQAGATQTGFTVRFSALRMGADTTLQYEARLDGVERAWRPLSQPEATYTALPPGSYTLLLRARHPGGAWSPVLHIPVAINPPWHGLLAVRLAAAALVAGAIWALIRHRNRTLRSLNQSLEALVGERTAQLKEARDTAEQARMATAEILTQASRTLKSPLQTLKGFLEVEGHGPHEGLPLAVSDHLDTLVQVIEGLQDLATLQKGRLPVLPQRFQPRVLLHDLTERLASRAKVLGVCLLVETEDDVPEHVLADGRRLRRILMTLAETAMEISRGGHVLIHLAWSMNPQGLLATVEDTRGPLSWPIPPSAEPIGQVLSRKVVEALGGTMDFTQPEFGQAALRFTLPAAGQTRWMPPASLAGQPVEVAVSDTIQREYLLRGLFRMGMVPGEGAPTALWDGRGPEPVGSRRILLAPHPNAELLSPLSDLALLRALTGTLPRRSVPVFPPLRGRVLVAEADLDHRLLLEALLRHAELEWTSVESIQAVLTALHSQAYHLLLLAADLPGLDPADLLQQLGAQDPHRTFHILLLTPEDLPLHPRMRGVESIEKPVHPSDLMEWMTRRLPVRELDAPPILDLPHLEQLREVLGDEAALVDYAQTLETDTLQRLEAIDQAVHEGRFEQSSRLAHDLKTNAGNLGLRRVQAAAQVLERTDASEPLAVHVERLARLRFAWEEAWAQVRRRTAL